MTFGMRVCVRVCVCVCVVFLGGKGEHPLGTGTRRVIYIFKFEKLDLRVGLEPTTS